MKVIKVVLEQDGKLVSTFALGEWQKEYAKGVETKPDTGYLFAYPRKDLLTALSDMGIDMHTQFWVAEAKVVSRIRSYNVSSLRKCWHDFWRTFSLHSQDKAAEYLLCSSITLVEQLR